MLRGELKLLERKNRSRYMTGKPGYYDLSTFIRKAYCGRLLRRYTRRECYYLAFICLLAGCFLNRVFAKFAFLFYNAGNKMCIRDSTHTHTHTHTHTWNYTYCYSITWPHTCKTSLTALDAILTNKFRKAFFFKF